MGCRYRVCLRPESVGAMLFRALCRLSGMLTKGTDDRSGGVAQAPVPPFQGLDDFRQKAGHVFEVGGV